MVAVELAGLSGLMTLLAWTEACGPVLYTRVRPHESGLWMRRYCEVEEYKMQPRGAPASAAHTHVSRRGSLKWSCSSS